MVASLYNVCEVSFSKRSVISSVVNVAVVKTHKNPKII